MRISTSRPHLAPTLNDIAGIFLPLKSAGWQVLVDIGDHFEAASQHVQVSLRLIRGKAQLTVGLSKTSGLSASAEEAAELRQLIQIILPLFPAFATLGQAYGA
jgi:hypothetical protein